MAAMRPTRLCGSAISTTSWCIFFHHIPPTSSSLSTWLDSLPSNGPTNLLIFYNDTMVFGKRSFLEAYRIAPDEAVTEKNTKSGWYASRLWSLNLQKPLMSPLLVEAKNEPTHQEDEVEGTLATGFNSPVAGKGWVMPVTPA